MSLLEDAYTKSTKASAHVHASAFKALRFTKIVQKTKELFWQSVSNSICTTNRL